MKRVAFGLLVTLCLAGAREASAANACVTAADKGQDLRAAGRLEDARATLLACTKPACHAVVRADCERWIRELDEELRAAAAEAEKRIEPPPATTSAMVPVKIDAMPDTPPPSATFPVVPVLLGGVGIVALGAFGFFELNGMSRYDALEDGCGRTRSCTDADLDPARSQFVAGGITLGVSVVALGAAAIVYFSRGASTDTSRVGITAHGAALSF